MKRPYARLVLVSLVLAAGAACAESSVESAAPEDASVLPAPANDAATDAATGHDADAAKPPLDTCTKDGWCSAPLPDVHPFGLQPLRIFGIAADETGGAWAVTGTSGISDALATSHLMHYEKDAWTPKFGVGFSQSERFPGALSAIASNGSGAFMAVGVSTEEPFAVVVRIDATGHFAVDHPANVPGLVAVAFTTTDEAWALDGAGLLYRSRTTDGGVPSWTAVPTPHPPDPNNFTTGPNVIFPSSATAGALYLAGHVNGMFDGPPGFGYVDTRLALPDGGSAWRSSVVRSEISVQAGIETAAARLWVATQTNLLGAVPNDGGAGDAGKSDGGASDGGASDGGASEGALDWSQSSPVLPVALNAFWARSATDVWAVGPVGRVYHYDGVAWADARLALNGAPVTTNALLAIAGVASGEIWAGGQDVSLHRAAVKGP